VTVEQTEPQTSGEQTEQKEGGRNTLLRQAYTAATSRLRDGHRDEFERLYQQEAQNRGVEYTPRLSPEQKAEKELADLLEKHPHLREKITG
jgi:hypothetical protein